MRIHERMQYLREHPTPEMTEVREQWRKKLRKDTNRAMFIFMAGVSAFVLVYSFLLWNIFAR